MTNEEFERRMEFIVEQQARFASDIQQLQEAQARTEQALGRTEQALARTEQIVAQTEQIVARLANVTSVGFKDVTAKIDALVGSHIRLTEAQSRTDDTLRNLIAVVDRYFREGRNGQSGQ